MNKNIEQFRGLAAFSRYALCLAGMLCLSACIVVKDFGEYWERGVDDPCVSEIVRHHFIEPSERVTRMRDIARILHAGQARYLMLADAPGRRGGTLHRFSVEDGWFVVYRLNETRRERFFLDYPGAPVRLTSETATLSELDDKTVALLGAVATRPEYWVETERFPYNPGELAQCGETSKPTN